MSFLSRSQVKRFALASVLTFAATIGYALAQATTPAPVVTYTDQVVPSQTPPQYDRYNSPLKAGQMTLEDVLQAHPKTPVQPLRPPIVSSPSVTAPVLSATSPASSSTNLMLMQGMKSVLQQNGSGGPVQLRAPHMQPAGIATATGQATMQPAAAPTASAPPTPVDIPAAPGVVFAPGQQPKNLAGAIPQPVTPVVPSIEPSSAETAVELQPAPTPSAPIAGVPPVVTPSAKPAPSSKLSSGCESHVSSWTKTCVEAGYPASFTGKITGETRTNCPDGSLQDVWIANSCASPDDSASVSYAPIPASRANSDQQIISRATSESGMTSGAASQPPVPEPSNASVMSSFAPSIRTDANCGAANGLAANVRPVTELCSSGEASDVSGDGPWRWNCKGMLGGMTVSCAAPMATASAAPVTPSSYAKPERTPASAALEDAACGSADGNGVDHAPASNLCAKGAPSRVNGTGPWTWACSGSNGGLAAACTAPKKTDGICGGAVRAATDQMPMADLCTAGYASAVTGDGPWNWTCSGLYGGSAATCVVAPKKDAVCGSASLAGHHETPQDNLCSVGQASSVHGGGPWNWTCSGANGGAAVTCNAPASVNGACGASNGVAASHTPSEDLCSHGLPTRVTGSGPWNWNCSGTDGGDTQSCTAPMVSRQQQEENAAASVPPASSAVVMPSTSSAADISANLSANNLCGGASELMALAAPDKDLCSTGKASSVTGNGPWTWTCSDGNGHVSDCSTLSPATSSSRNAATKMRTRSAAPKSMMEAPAAPSVASEVVPTVDVKMATCGSSAGQGSNSAPSEGLCSIGRASSVKGSGPWTWTCSKDKTKASCEAPKYVEASCGPSNGSVQKYAPAKGLCTSGTATDVQGTGPWLWTCVGTGGGASISCSATSQAQTRVDGSCGAAANSPATSMPDVNLCDSGIQSNVYGEGPWTWTCSGLNGGVATSCVTQKNVPAAPPPPGPALNGLCGSANGVAMVVQPMDDLCSTGTVTGVSGNGPWNWNCLGANGGMTVSCTAPLQPPAPITGVCGGANGVPTLTMPKSGLCSAGISSSVSGKGPWTWSCSGTNGGGAVGCVAPLAGTDVGSLPSLVTTPAAGEAPAPHAAPTSRVTSSGLSTPKLPTGPLPPLETGSLPAMGGSKSFAAPPQPSPMPPIPMQGTNNAAAPTAEPDLPEDAVPLQPPPIRDSMKTAPALKKDMQNSIPGNHFALDDDISTIAFTRGSENIDADVLPKLDKLAAVLLDHSGARITLTAYADNSGIPAREARRLSLTRALAIRDYLTAKGVSSGRIDVRALGANVSSGDTDRVDVKTN